MDLKDLLGALRRRWLTVALLVCLGVGAAAASVVSTTPLFASSARLFVAASDRATTADSLQGAELSQRRVSAYADVVTSRRLAEEVRARSGVDRGIDELASRVSAVVVGGTINLNLTYLDRDPVVARAVTQAYAESLVDLVRELETPEEGGTPPIRVAILDPASVPGQAVTPRTERDLAIGLVLGLVLGIGLALLRDHLDVSLRERDELEAHGARALGVVAHDRSARERPLEPPGAGTPVDESFRAIRTGLQFLDVDAPSRTLMVTSASPSDGKTTVSVQLAFSLARSGRRVLLVEGDLRRSNIAEVLGLDSAGGLGGVLVGQSTLDDAVQRHSSGLEVLVAGPSAPNPAELLESAAMRDLLAEASGRYDVVLVDAPPLLPVSDAVVLARHVDRVLLVVRYATTSREQLDRCVERLGPVLQRPPVSILNRVPRRRLTGQGYGYGYGYGPERRPSRDRRRRSARRARPVA